MPKPAGSNTALWLPCAGVLAAASAAAVWGPAHALMQARLAVAPACTQFYD